MATADLSRALAQLSDQEVELTLNQVVAAYAAERGYEAKQLFADESSMAEAIQQVGAEVGVTLGGVREVDKLRRAAALRRVLGEMSAVAELRPAVESALTNRRKTLLEPVTSALVLSGLIIVLSLDVDIDYRKKGGKSSIAIRVKKRPTAEKLLKKIAAFF